MGAKIFIDVLSEQATQMQGYFFLSKRAKEKPKHKTSRRTDMIKHTTLTLALSSALLGGAYAQQTPASPTTLVTPPVTMPALTTPAPSPTMPAAGAPVAGANSFTEAQAKTRLENQGFTAVSALAKDKDGIWRGKAMKAGRGLDVSVDYQGNIVEK